MTGADQLFYKRKARKLKEQQRKIACRDPYDTVLIVCEGEKTEKNYFDSLVKDLKLNTANVLVANNSLGSAPKTVVDFAIKTYKGSEGGFDKVFCVIDKDRHSSYSAAIAKIQSTRLKRGHTIEAISSIPCFEYWLLLHFRQTSRNYYSGPGSVCSRVISDLKKCPGMANYEKGDANTFDRLKDKLEIAIRNSEIILNNCQNTGTDNPSTKIHQLVVYLSNIKNIPNECRD